MNAPRPPVLVPRIFVQKVIGFDVCNTCGRQDHVDVKQLVFGWSEHAVISKTPSGGTSVSLCGPCRRATVTALTDGAREAPAEGRADG